MKASGFDLIIGRHIFTPTSLSRLQPGNKLSDDIVNYFIMELQSTALPEYPLIRDSFFVERWNMKKSHVLKDNSRFVFPVNYEDHWVLVQMDFNNKKITVFDSVQKPEVDPMLYQVWSYYRVH